MADFLRVNGTVIPLEQGSARRVNSRQASERSISGGPLTSRLGTFNIYSAQTILLSLAEAETIRGLFEGAQAFSLTANGSFFGDVDTPCIGRLVRSEYVTQEWLMLELELAERLA